MYVLKLPELTPKSLIETEDIIYIEVCGKIL